jgi:phosphinothricin acetyltransferase
VKAIYEAGIATGNATFETAAPGWDDWDAAHLAEPRLVAALDGEVVAWAALAPYSRRAVYGGVAESSIYVADRARGRGVGRALLRELVHASEQAGLWTLLAGVFPENVASLALHHSCGFRVVGTLTCLGRLDGVWRDVVLLEHRSD